MKKIWFDEAWEDYTYWQMQDKKTLKRINMLLKDIERGNLYGEWHLYFSVSVSQESLDCQLSKAVFYIAPVLHEVSVLLSPPVPPAAVPAPSPAVHVPC